MDNKEDNQLIVDILDSDEYDGFGEDIEEAITIDDDGTKWCTLKKAADITGLSQSTIRRYFKNNKLTGKEGLSPYGKTYYVLFDEVQALADDKEFKRASSNLRIQDSRIELERFLSQYESKHIGPLTEQVSRLEELQANTLSLLNEKGESLADKIENLTKRNEELYDEIKDLKEIVETQKQMIEESQKKKGFWANLFKK